MSFHIDHAKKARKIFSRLIVILGLSLMFFTVTSYYYKKHQIRRDLASIDPLGEGDARCSVDQAPQDPWPSLIHKQFEVKAGETLAQVLYNAGVSSDQVAAITTAIKPHFAPSDLQVGCSVALRCLAYDEQEEESGQCDLQRLSFLKDSFSRVIVERNDDEEEESNTPLFQAYVQDRELIKKKVFVRGEIHSGLYADATKAGVPQATLSEMMKVFSYDVDFQRDLQKGDQFEFLYVTLTDKQGHFVAAGSMIYGQLILSGSPLQIYRHRLKDGDYSYFNEKGESVVKSLLKTPVDGSRVTSGFTLHRRHPILGYTRAHKGIDFGVRSGTPIMAAGDGLIVEAKYSPSYGNYVKIKHKSGYETLYAHMSRIGSKSIAQHRIKQGQVIGLSGCTGLCSGPHVHYEVIVGGVHVNPQKIKQIPNSSSLAGNELSRFLNFRKEVQKVILETPAHKLADRLNHLDSLKVF